MSYVSDAIRRGSYCRTDTRAATMECRRSRCCGYWRAAVDTQLVTSGDVASQTKKPGTAQTTRSPSFSIRTIVVAAMVKNRAVLVPCQKY